MKLLLALPRGFCAGVVRAIETVKKTLTMYGAPVYVKHAIVHNRHVVEDLERRGALFVKEIADIPKGAIVIYSAHGVSPDVRREAEERNLTEIDATCGLVTKIHSAAIHYAKRGYKIIIIGHKKHVEVIGAAGERPDVTVVVESTADVEKLSFSADEKLFYLTQTTLSITDIEEIAAALKARYPHIVTLPVSSICYATTNRQKALANIMDGTELVIVVGDPDSSNSNRLREIGAKRNIPSYLVNGANEIQKEWLRGVRCIAMTAGASTPESVVQECISRLKSLGVSEIEEVCFAKEQVVFSLPI